MNIHIHTPIEPRITSTFKSLENAIEYADTDTWPRIVLPKTQCFDEFAMEMKVLREIKKLMWAAVVRGDEKAAGACRRMRVKQACAAYVARERWKNPSRYLRGLY